MLCFSVAERRSRVGAGGGAKFQVGLIYCQMTSMPGQALPRQLQVGQPPAPCRAMAGPHLPREVSAWCRMHQSHPREGRDVILRRLATGLRYMHISIEGSMDLELVLDGDLAAVQERGRGLHGDGAERSEEDCCELHRGRRGWLERFVMALWLRGCRRDR
jgi:hypothetical protein